MKKPCPVCKSKHGHRPESHVLSRQGYISRIHEGGRGGYGIATHDILIYHDRALRLGMMEPALRGLCRAVELLPEDHMAAFGKDCPVKPCPICRFVKARRRWLKGKEGK